MATPPKKSLGRGLGSLIGGGVVKPAALCRTHDARLLLDPSVVSVFNVDVLAHTDVVVSSLTKYTASAGDLTAGVAAINPAGPDAAELRRRIAEKIEPLYARDLARLAAQIGRTDAVLERIEDGINTYGIFTRLG